MSHSVLTPFVKENVLSVKNRIVMSAMTRGFADTEHCVTDLSREYYARRAKDGIGLILTEGTVIHPTGDGYNNVPHIETQEQVDSWKPVVNAVQEHNTKIFCQLWHCGRISHSDYTGGVPPVSSTNVAAEGMNRQNNKPFGEPHALTPEEIPQVYQYFLDSAKNAISAGFDGFQLHFAHGYLVDQFFDSRVNDRADDYGGSVENRCRFAIELLEKVLSKYSADRVAVRLSPSREMGGIYDWPDLEEMIKHIIPRFQELGLRILDISCARSDYYKTSGRIIRMVRPLWDGVIMGGASLSINQANQEVDEGLLDLITWGRFSLANPDLVEKLKNDQPLKDFNPEMLSTLF